MLEGTSSSSKAPRFTGAAGEASAVGAAIPAATGSASTAAPIARIRLRQPRGARDRPVLLFGPAALPKRMNSALFLLLWRCRYRCADNTPFLLGGAGGRVPTYHWADSATTIWSQMCSLDFIRPHRAEQGRADRMAEIRRENRCDRPVTRPCPGVDVSAGRDIRLLSKSAPAWLV
jgi:hypothetical protein